MLKNVPQIFSFSDNLELSNLNSIGDKIFRLVEHLYPYCRSITGDGVRQTLSTLKQHIPLKIHEVPTGTEVFDWTVPKEWNIRDAYVKNSVGQKILDFNDCNLHILNYSIPIHKKLSLAELKEHLFTIPEQPDLIPYRTSYYKENWGFCLSYNQFLELQEDQYEVYVDSSLEDGFLTYGEYYVPGQSKEEILISTHICHPSLCNDNLSGIAVATYLARYLSQSANYYSYRFLFIPGTIGSITWLALHEEETANIKHGVVLTCVGDAGQSTYKRTRQGNADVDRAFIHVLQHSGQSYEVIDFFPYGYDERQYCSPGFNLAVGCLMRSQHGQFPEYHTSADNLDFVKPESLADSFSKCLSALQILEGNKTYLNLNPKCEPRLGKRGLYRGIGGEKDGGVSELALLWILNLSDGEHSLLDIAERSQISFDIIRKAANALLSCNLLQEVNNL